MSRSALEWPEIPFRNHGRSPSTHPGGTADHSNARVRASAVSARAQAATPQGGAGTASQPPALIGTLRALKLLISQCRDLPEPHRPDSRRRRCLPAPGALGEVACAVAGRLPRQSRARCRRAPIGTGDATARSRRHSKPSPTTSRSSSNTAQKRRQAGGSVVVRVRTLKGSEESRNWQVLYLAKGTRGSGGQARTVSAVEQSDERNACAGPLRHVAAPTRNRQSQRADGRQGRRRKERAAARSARAPCSAR